MNFCFAAQCCKDVDIVKTHTFDSFKLKNLM